MDLLRLYKESRAIALTRGRAAGIGRFGGARSRPCAHLPSRADLASYRCQVAQLRNYDDDPGNQETDADPAGQACLPSCLLCQSGQRREMVITIGIREIKDSYGSVFPAKDFVKGRGTGRLAGAVVTGGSRLGDGVSPARSPAARDRRGAYQGWREVSSEVVRRREVPACEIPFIINFGATFGLIDPARPGAATPGWARSWLASTTHTSSSSRAATRVASRSISLCRRSPVLPGPTRRAIEQVCRTG